tara:strand:- start:1117 stop:1239 length:123 start_codon:yes stop_codon:yes gene_type:complete
MNIIITEDELKIIIDTLKESFFGGDNEKLYHLAKKLEDNK